MTSNAAKYGDLQCDSEPTRRESLPGEVGDVIPGNSDQLRLASLKQTIAELEAQVDRLNEQMKRKDEQNSELGIKVKQLEMAVMKADDVTKATQPADTHQSEEGVERQNTRKRVADVEMVQKREQKRHADLERQVILLKQELEDQRPDAKLQQPMETEMEETAEDDVEDRLEEHSYTGDLVFPTTTDTERSAVASTSVASAGQVLPAHGQVLPAQTNTGVIPEQAITTMRPETQHTDELCKSQDWSKVAVVHEELYELINARLDKYREIGHRIIMVHPADYNKVYVIGVKVRLAQTDLDPLTSFPQFKYFTISTFNVHPYKNGLPKYTRELKSLPFCMEKIPDGEDRRPVNDVRTTCELIVKRPGKGPGDARYYGVSTAHAFLSEDQRRQLFDGDGAMAAIREQIRDEMEDYRWNLRAHNDKDVLKMKSPLFSYQHYARNGPLYDMSIFELRAKELKDYQWVSMDHVSDAVNEESLQTYYYHDRPYTVRGWLPIHADSTADMVQLVNKQIRVFIGQMEGVFTLASTHQRDLGHHLSFCTKHRLKDGDSGSMVYVMNKNDNDVYIAGMLVGVFDSFEQASGIAIYQAVIVSAALDFMERHHQNQLGGLVMMENVLKDRQLGDIIGDLQTGSFPRTWRR